MAEQTVNPELILAAAIMARPGVDWCRPIIAGHPDYNDGKDIEADYVAYFDFDGPEDLEIRFDPLESADDFKALLVCLMMEGWMFGYIHHLKVFCAEDLVKGIRTRDPSLPLLLYRALSAQTNIPMWVEHE